MNLTCVRVALLDSDATLIVESCLLVPTAAAAAAMAAADAAAAGVVLDVAVAVAAPESVDVELFESDGLELLMVAPSASSDRRKRTFPPEEAAAPALEGAVGDGAWAEAAPAAAAADSTVAAWMLPMEEEDMGERMPLSSETCVKEKFTAV